MIGVESSFRYDAHFGMIVLNTTFCLEGDKAVIISLLQHVTRWITTENIFET